MSPDLVAGVLGGVFALVALVGVFTLVRFAARGEQIERPEVGPWVGHRHFGHTFDRLGRCDQCLSLFGYTGRGCLRKAVRR